MANKLIESILRVCNVLNAHKVEYLIVGGTAVALHGHFRMSTNAKGEIVDKPDLDFWYNPSYQNYFNLLDALEELGQHVEGYRNEDTPTPKQSFFKYEFEEFTLDLLPKVKSPLIFHSSYKKREVVHYEGVDIAFISYDDLIADKEATARAKDLDDIEYLKRINSR